LLGDLLQMAIVLAEQLSDQLEVGEGDFLVLPQIQFHGPLSQGVIVLSYKYLKIPNFPIECNCQITFPEFQ
jgi:hypothetical protein